MNNAIEKLQLIRPFLNNSLTSEDDSIHQRILNVAYNKWQEDNDDITGYTQMVNFMEEQFGPLAKLAVLVGKYNQQTCNGGHGLYFFNGFASVTEGGYNDEHADIDLHKELVELVKQYGDIPLQSELVAIMEKFQIVDNMETCSHCEGAGELEEEDEEGNIVDIETCHECNGHGEYEDGMTVYFSDRLDKQYYKINEQVEEQFDEFFAKLLA